MVQIRELINTSILNSEWVGFNGDSEYIDENGELQMGCWTFKEILQDPQGTPYQLTDEIDNYAIYGDCSIPVKNEKGNVCIIELGYTHKECEKCKHNYQSYHCMGCNNYYGNIDDLESFCSYCENTPYEDGCDNCVWNMEM